jgi:hypothetical protein
MERQTGENRVIFTHSSLNIFIRLLGLLNDALSIRSFVWHQWKVNLPLPTAWRPMEGVEVWLIPWSGVLPEKLSRPELLKKLPAFYETRNFITAFTRSRHLSLFWTRSISSMPPHPSSRRSILILSSHLRLRLPSGSFPQVCALKRCMHLPSPIRATCLAHLSLLYFITLNVFVEYIPQSYSLCSLLHSPVTSSLLSPNIPLTALFSKLSAYVPPSVWATKFHTHVKHQAKLYFCLS